MTTSVFILNITDMKKSNILKKFFYFLNFSVVILALILLVVYLMIYTSKYNFNTFLSFIAPVVFFVIFLLHNCLLVYFHKKGFYTSKQAIEFYTKCCEQNISLVQEENFEKAKDIYFPIFGTDKYLGEGTLSAHMADIYNAGKEITEKQ